VKLLARIGRIWIAERREQLGRRIMMNHSSRLTIVLLAQSWRWRRC